MTPLYISYEIIFFLNFRFFTFIYLFIKEKNHVKVIVSPVSSQIHRETTKEKFLEKPAKTLSQCVFSEKLLRVIFSLAVFQHIWFYYPLYVISHLMWPFASPRRDIMVIVFLKNSSS